MNHALKLMGVLAVPDVSFTDVFEVSHFQFPTSNFQLSQFRFADQARNPFELISLSEHLKCVLFYDKEMCQKCFVTQMNTYSRLIRQVERFVFFLSVIIIFYE